MNEKFFSMIGMARRAGKLSAGEAAVKDAVRRQTAELVILAADASENTKKSVTNSCSFYKISVIEVPLMDKLGECIGCARTAAVSVNDYNLAKAVSDKFNQDKSRKG